MKFSIVDPENKYVSPLSKGLDRDDWNKWFVFPLKYEKLSINAHWLINISYDSDTMDRRLVAEISIPLFERYQ
jgi:hypothetical protein